MSVKINSIFLVDDDPDDRFLFEEALNEAQSGIHFESAHDGIDALEKLHKFPTLPDLIFMDVNMPRMNGIDCLKELKNTPALEKVAVFMYSTSSHYKQECQDFGASAYIEKPDDFGKLCALLGEIANDPEAFKSSRL